MLEKIIAIADVHIFNNKRFNEHEEVFKKLDESIKKENPDLILLLGDIIDSKNKLSPEQLVLTRTFFKMLSNHCRVAYIIGNHDRSLQTDNRIDSLSTIVDTIENTKNEILFLKESKLYDLGYSNCKFAVWSWIENNKKPIINKNDGDYIIGLYHGVIDGATTKDGHKLSGGVKLSEFDECDIVIAGDIHNKTSFRNDEIHYVSSLLQVSINEDAEGSYMVYNWEGDTFLPKRVNIENPEAVQTFDIDEIENINVIKTKAIRIKYDTDEVNRKNVKETAKKIKEKFGVKVNTYPIIKKKKTFNITNDKDNENEAIVDYFSEFINENKAKLNIKEEAEIDALKALNNEYKTDNDLEYELGDYYVKSIMVNNLLTYPVDNTTIPFDKEGLIGILGKNRAGKSSIIKILQFILFGELPNNSLLYSFLNKNNRDKDGIGEVILEKNGKLYKISRSIKPKKNKKADSSVSFLEINTDESVVTDLNKSTKTETDKEIKRYLGLNDYFEILSIFSAQKKQVEFIDCKNADRLSLLNKFLNLHEYEKKHEMVKAKIKIESGKLQTLSSFLSNKRSDEDLLSLIEKAENETKNKENESNILGNLVKHLEDTKDDLFRELSLYQNKSYGEDNLEEILNKKKDIISLKERNETEISGTTLLSTELYENQIKILESEVSNLKSQYKLERDAYTEKYDLKRFTVYKIPTGSLLTDLKYTKIEIDKLDSQLNKNFCDVCKAPIKQEVKEKIAKQKEESLLIIDQITKRIDEINKSNDEYEIEYDKVCSFSELIGEKENLLSKLNEKYKTLTDKVNSLNNQNLKYSKELESLEKAEQLVNEVKKAKEKVSILTPKYNNAKNEYDNELENFNELKTDINNLKNELNNLRKELEEVLSTKKKVDKLESEIVELNRFAEIVSKKGLPLFVLNKSINAINNKINAIVSQVFDFELNFKINEEKGEAIIEYIYPNDKEANEVGMASGSETFLINLCIKVGLSQISKLPKISTLFVDEGYDVLDSDSIEKLPNVFDVLKNYYSNIYTITHLDEVKMILDDKIELEKENGYTVIKGL